MTMKADTPILLKNIANLTRGISTWNGSTRTAVSISNVTQTLCRFKTTFQTPSISSPNTLTSTQIQDDLRLVWRGVHQVGNCLWVPSVYVASKRQRIRRKAVITPRLSVCVWNKTDSETNSTRCTQSRIEGDTYAYSQQTLVKNQRSEINQRKRYASNHTNH